MGIIRGVHEVRRATVGVVWGVYDVWRATMGVVQGVCEVWKNVTGLRDWAGPGILVLQKLCIKDGTRILKVRHENGSRTMPTNLCQFNMMLS